MSAVRRALGRAKRELKRQFRRRVGWPILSRTHHWRTKVYFISYPKSGRTWLRVMMGKALCDRYGLPEPLLLKTYRLTGKAGLPRTRWWHDGSDLAFAHPYQRMSAGKRRYRNKNVVVLVRNVKDVLVSSYFQATKGVHTFQGSISEFIRDDRFGARKVLTFYNQWYLARSVPRAFHVFRYEDLHRDTRGTLAGALGIVGAQGIDDGILAAAIEYGRFDKMKDIEQGKVFDNPVLRVKNDQDPESFKVRRGVVRGYVDYLSEDDIRYIDGVIAEVGDLFDSEGLKVE